MPQASTKADGPAPQSLTREQRIERSWEKEGGEAAAIFQAKLYYTAAYKASDHGLVIDGRDRYYEDGITDADHWRVAVEFIADHQADAPDESALMTPRKSTKMGRFFRTDEAHGADAPEERFIRFMVERFGGPPKAYRERLAELFGDPGLNYRRLDE